MNLRALCLYLSALTLIAFMMAFLVSRKRWFLIYGFCRIRYYRSITASNKIFPQNYSFFGLEYNIINHKSKEQTLPYYHCPLEG